MSTAARADPNAIELGPLRVLPADLLARTGGRVLMLSSRETHLLIALANRAGRIVDRDELSRLAWGKDLRPGDRSVDVYVRRLRVKLEEAAPGWRFIHTHVGLGYRLAPEWSLTPEGNQANAAGRSHLFDMKAAE
jgi:DNA-binding response OmpR family regulator